MLWFLQLHNDSVIQKEKETYQNPFPECSLFAFIENGSLGRMTSLPPLSF